MFSLLTSDIIEASIGTTTPLPSRQHIDIERGYLFHNIYIFV